MDKNLFRQALKKIAPYIPGQSIQETRERYGLKEAVKLASNENPSGVAPAALKVIQKEFWEINYYPLPEAPALKEKLARKLKIEKNHLIIGNGSDEIMLLAALAFLNPGDKVLIPAPSFQTYEIVSAISDAQIIKIPFDNYQYNLENFLQKIDARTKMIFLCNPNNPTGVIFDQKDWQNFIKAAPDKVVIFIDEAYAEYVQDKNFPKTFKDLTLPKPIIVTRTFSKIYGLAGLRVGYGLAQPEIIEALYKVRLPFSVNHLAQVAAAAGLDDEEFVQESLRLNEAGKIYLYPQLKALGLKFIETQANFIYIEVGMNAQTLAEEMARLGVIIRPLTGFGQPQAIRVTIGLPEQNEKFILALTQCLDWLR